MGVIKRYDQFYSGGKTPTVEIDSTSKHWIINGTDTGVVAQGEKPTITIDSSTKHWIVDGTDTGIKAEGTDGRSIASVYVDDDNNIIATYTDSTAPVTLGKITVNVEADFLSTNGFGNLKYNSDRGTFSVYQNSTWNEVAITYENSYIIQMMPQQMKSVMGGYDVDSQHYKLKFEEPDDTVIDSQIACVVDHIVVVRKKNSMPTSIADGTTILTLPRNQFGSYKNSWYIDSSFTPSVGDIYYYGCFPISTTGFANTGTTNCTNALLCKDFEIYGMYINQSESEPGTWNSSYTTFTEGRISYNTKFDYNGTEFYVDNQGFSSAKMNYVTSAFDYGSWEDAWFIKECKPCILNFDGTVYCYLDKNDYTKDVDGNSVDITSTCIGNVMVEFPKIWYKVIPDKDNATILFSNEKVDNEYKDYAYIDYQGNHKEHFYMSAYNNCLIDNKIRSVSGGTVLQYKTRTEEISYAKANGNGWYTEDFGERILINALLTLIGKSTHSQHIFGFGYNGQGGAVLGYNNTNGLFYGLWNGNLPNKVFGIENYWGNEWIPIAGLINANGIAKVKLCYGTEDGSTTSTYNLDGTGYVEIGNIPLGENQLTTIMYFNSNGIMFIPKTAGGSTSTYYCDGTWAKNETIYYGHCGSANNDSYSGIFAFDLLNIPTFTGAYISPKISYK